MPTTESHAAEVHRLRNTMRDLVAFSTLPAVWAGYAPSRIAESLADILVSTLSLDLVYVRIRAERPGDYVEIVRGKDVTVGHRRAIAGAVAPCLTRSESPTFIIDPLGGGELRVAVARFGHSGDDGAVVVCSRRPDFPTEAERLLLGVGTNQTAIVLQRKQAEQALSEERERLQITLSSIGDAVISTDPEGRVTFMNAVAESLTGWTQAEAAGRPLPEVFHIINERTRQVAENPALRALYEGTVVGLANHTVLIARDGTARAIDDSAAPMRSTSGEVTGVVLVFRDITARQQAEEEIRRKEADLTDFVENSTLALHWVGPDGVILWANQAELDMVGYTREEYVGRNIAEFHADPPVIEDILGRLTNKERLYGYEARLRCKDGSIKQVVINSSVLWEGERFVHTRCFMRDVTEQKLAEEVRARLAAIVESSDDAIISKTLDGVIRSWNTGAARIFGYSAAEAIGQPITLIIPPERLDEERVILEQLRQGKRIDHFETIRVAREERRLDISLTVSPIRDGDGRIIGASKVARDISARKRAEAENQRLLLEVEAERRRLADVFQHAPSFMCVLHGPDHVFERANNRYYELLGRRGIIGKPVREALPEVEGQGFFEILDRVYQTGEPFVGTDVRVTLRRGGHLEERILEFVYQPMRDAEGTVSGILAHGIDLTERKHAEADLYRVTTESERRKRLYETILTATPDFVYVFSLDHRILYANDALVAMWGHSLEDVIGKTFVEVGYEPWHAEMHCREIDQVRAKKLPVRGEAPFTGTHGRRIYDYIFVPVLGGDGEVEAVAGTTRDVTDRKVMEDELRESDRKKDDFIALLAHELRNPLAPIRNGLQVIRMALGDGNTAVAQARDMMDRQLSHMVRLIDDLLDISRINRNKMELRRSRVLLADMVSSAVETARPLIDAEGHELNISLPQRAVYLDADLTRLAQIFSNLLTNSAKYTERGGKIWLSAERTGGKIAISVRDTGIGIPAESLASIFDMFSQVDRSVERSTGGLGIGLALVKGLVEMHGGTVTAASAGEGRGSTFTVTLPELLERREPAPVETDQGQAEPVPGRRILVVDDSRDGAESLAMMLRLLGNEVHTAYDGIEAVERSDRLRPEVILMDVGMPHLNGLDATRRIRGQEWGKTVVIIALTGWGQDGDRERSREAGCDGHLVKPVELTDLEKLLGELPGNGSEEEVIAQAE